MALETILGNTKPVHPDSLIYVEVAGVLITDAERPAKPPIITANFERAAKGYVVIEVPEDIERLFGRVAGEERELIAEYIFDIELANENAGRALKNYEEEQEVLQGLTFEENFVGLFLDALARDGKKVGPTKGIYSSLGYLPDMRITHLMMALDSYGFSEDQTLKSDVEKMLRRNGGEPVNLTDQQGLVDKLVGRIGMVIPRDNPPEAEIKKIPPLLEELDNIVSAAYRGEQLQGISLTMEAWQDIGINPEETYQKARGSFKKLAGPHMLVKINGTTGKADGSLKLPQLITNPPKILRGHFRRPAELADDAYALSYLVGEEINDYLERDEKGKIIGDAIAEEKKPFLGRAIFAGMLQRSTALTSWIFPNWYALVISDKEPAAKSSFVERYSIFQNWYRTNVSKDELKRYEDIAAEVVDLIIGSFADRGIVIAQEGTGVPVRHIDDLQQLIGNIRSLVDAVPEELYEIREARAYIRFVDAAQKEVKTLADEGRTLSPRQQLLHMMRVDICSRYRERNSKLEEALGLVLHKGEHEWALPVPNKVIADTLVRYNIGKTVAPAVTVAAKTQ